MDANIRILVVDDEPDIRQLLRILLENRSYQVAEASSGEEAVRRLRTDPAYDLVVMDIMMPGMDGVEACRSIRSFSTAPILFLTAKTQLGDKASAYASGGDDFLPKPFSQSELLMKVDSLLRRYRVYKGKREEVLDASLHLDEDRRCAVKMAGWWSSPARNTTFSNTFSCTGGRCWTFAPSTRAPGEKSICPPPPTPSWSTS